MPAQRANQRALAASRIVENLAYALPPYRNELLNLINHTVGYPDHTPGASLPTGQTTRLLEGKCTAPVSYMRDEDPAVVTEFLLVDCGRERPCSIHDHPVTLTIPEHAAAKREQWRADLADADQVIATITLLANDLLHRARRTVPLVPLPVPRCDATGMDGYLIARPPIGDGWSDLACTKPRSRGTLCENCSQREWLWRKRRDLKPRTDGVMAHPAGTDADVAEYQRHGLRRDP